MEFTISYTTLSISALTGNLDYSEINDSVVVTEDGDTVISFPFFLLDDYRVEGNETVRLELSTSNPKIVFSNPSITVTIIDNDRREHVIIYVCTCLQFTVIIVRQ